MAVALIGFTLVLLARRPAAQIDEFIEIQGTLNGCRVTDTEIRVDYTAPSGRTSIRLIRSDPSLWPSPAHAEIVGSAFHVQGGCLSDGAPIRVTLCPRCVPVSVVAVERLASRLPQDDAPQGPWIVRSYFDRGRGDEERAALFMASRVIAQYNRADGGSRSVWIRDRLDRSLFAYSSAARAEAAVEEFGRPLFRSGIGQLVEIFKRHGTANGLVRGLPFMPSDLRAPAFVGAWGQFAAEVFVEHEDGRLTRLYGAPPAAPDHKGQR
jgi:hypothetical protein